MWFKRVVVGDNGTAPVDAPFHIKATAEPTATPTKGDMYFDSTANALMQYNGSAWEQVGASPSGNVAIGGTLGVTGVATLSNASLLLPSDSLDITFGTTNPVHITKSANTLTMATGDTLAMDVATVASTLGVTGVATFNNASTVFASNSADIKIGTTNPVNLTFSANTLTAAAGDTFAVTDADKLKVGGVIVPAHVYESFTIRPHATITEYDLMIAHRAIQVIEIKMVPSTLQGGALTGTVVKATGTATPVKTTTPMIAADALDFNAGAYTVVTPALTATGADLILAAGERIGIDFSAALTAGLATITIAYKYV